MSSNKILKQRNEITHSKDFWSLPKEEAIAQLMCEFNMSREEAEAVLQRDRTQLRRHAVEQLSEEEFNRVEEEAANSPSILTLSRKDSKKQSSGDDEHNSD